MKVLHFILKLIYALIIDEVKPVLAVVGRKNVNATFDLSDRTSQTAVVAKILKLPNFIKPKAILLSYC